MTTSQSSSNSYFQSLKKEKPVKYKVIVLGELKTGKTSLIRRLDKGIFTEYAENEFGKEKCIYKTDIDGTPIQVMHNYKYANYICISTIIKAFLTYNILPVGNLILEHALIEYLF